MSLAMLDEIYVRAAASVKEVELDSELLTMTGIDSIETKSILTNLGSDNYIAGYTGALRATDVAKIQADAPRQFQQNIRLIAMKLRDPNSSTKIDLPDGHAEKAFKANEAIIPADLKADTVDNILHTIYTGAKNLPDAEKAKVCTYLAQASFENLYTMFITMTEHASNIDASRKTSAIQNVMD